MAIQLHIANRIFRLPGRAAPKPVVFRDRGLVRQYSFRDADFLTVERLGPMQSLSPEGFLIIRNVPLARTGPQLYSDQEIPIKGGADGRIVIDRFPDEVFRPATIASLNGKAVTLDHPDDDVTPENYSTLAVGHVIDPRRGLNALDNLLIGDLVITNPEAIKAIRSHEVREVSVGYKADYEETGLGRGKQRNIICNHLALVRDGRCGPICRIGDKAFFPRHEADCGCGACSTHDEEAEWKEAEHPRDGPSGRFTEGGGSSGGAKADKSQQKPTKSAETKAAPINDPSEENLPPKTRNALAEHGLKFSRVEHVSTMPRIDQITYQGDKSNVQILPGDPDDPDDDMRWSRYDFDSQETRFGRGHDELLKAIKGEGGGLSDKTDRGSGSRYDVQRKAWADPPRPPPVYRPKEEAGPRRELAQPSQKRTSFKHEDFTKAGFRFAALDQQYLPSFVEHWNEHVRTDPEAFKAKLTGSIDNSTLEVERAAGNKWIEYVDGEAPPADQGGWVYHGNLGGEGPRSGAFGEYGYWCDPENKTSEFVLCTLSDVEQGKGHAKKILSGAIEQFEQMGIDKVHIHANIDVGGYAWARYGWTPSQEEWAGEQRSEGLRGDLKHRINYYANSNPGAMTREEKKQLHDLINSDDPRTIWAVADNKFGKNLLYNQSWRGSLDLGDAQAYQRFQSYLKGDGKKGESVSVASSLMGDPYR